MANFILHHNGVYQIYTTIADGPCYERGLTLAELEEITRREYGEQGMRNLPARLERAHATGCSALSGETLAECLECNRAGPGESHLSVEEFIKKYLTTDEKRARDLP